MVKAKPKKKHPRGVRSVLTEQQKVVAHLYIKHGSRMGPTEAAKILGIPLAEVKAILRSNTCARYIEQYNKRFLDVMAHYELSQVTRFSCTREDVIGRLHVLALTPPDETRGTITGQVEALNAITEILGLKFSPRDADTFFKDKTPDELRNYALYGKFDPTEEEKSLIDAHAPSEPANKP